MSTCRHFGWYRASCSCEATSARTTPPHDPPIVLTLHHPMRMELHISRHPETTGDRCSNFLHRRNKAHVLGLRDQNARYVIVVGAVRLINEKSQWCCSPARRHVPKSPTEAPIR